MASLITKTASEQAGVDGFVSVPLVRIVGGATNNPDGTPAGGSPSFLPPGRAAAAASVPVVSAIEDSPNNSSRIASAAGTTNPTLAKATPGKLFRVMGNNVKASVVYLKFYNKATAPTVGTDVPVITIPLAASSVFDKSLEGYQFTTGIAYGLTTDAADSGTTALTAGDILGFTAVFS